MVRLATPQDLDRLIELGEMFSSESPFPFSFSRDKFTHSFNETMSSPNVVVIVYEDKGVIKGLLVGAVNQPLFSEDKVATELAWFMDPTYRGSKGALSLLRAFEEWAEYRDCKFISVGSLANLTTADKMYSKLRYTLVEKGYLKVI